VVVVDLDVLADKEEGTMALDVEGQDILVEETTGRRRS
jgi:hypothetical protein